MTNNHIKNQKHTLFGTFWIVFLFSSMQLGSKFVLDVGIKTTPTDIAILFSLIFLPVIKQFRFRINRYIFILIILIFAGFLLEMLSALFTHLPKNITLGVALLRNASLIFLIFQINYDYKRLSRWIVVSGVLFSIVAIIGFVKAIPNYTAIVFNRSLWDPGIFYILDTGVLRLTGLRGDPNIFFLVNLLPLLLSISLIREKRNLFSVLMFTIILIASLLTFSRTGILLLGLLLFIIILKKINFKKIFLTFFVILSIIVVSMYISETYDVPTPYDVIIQRFEKTVKTSRNIRIQLWKKAWDGFKESPIFGKGGRYVVRKSVYHPLRKTGTAGFYAHNDYLEILSSHGLIGFTLMSLLYLYILFFIKNKYKSFRENYLFTSSSQLFIFMLIAAFFHTLFYTPFIWFPVALIFSVRSKHC